MRLKHFIVSLLGNYKKIKTNEAKEICYRIGSEICVFLRLHKSYLVNMRYIKVFESDEVLMQDRTKFNISICRKREVIERYFETDLLG